MPNGHYCPPKRRRRGLSCERGRHRRVPPLRTHCIASCCRALHLPFLHSWLLLFPTASSSCRVTSRASLFRPSSTPPIPACSAGGGVDGAIHRAGGPAILADCQKIRSRQGGCKTGEAVITTGSQLPAAHVIHTVGPVWKGGHRGEPELLANCYRHSLRLIEKHKLESIAFPSISTGIYGYPKEKAAAIAVREVRQWRWRMSFPKRWFLWYLMRKISGCTSRSLRPSNSRKAVAQSSGFARERHEHSKPDMSKLFATLAREAGASRYRLTPTRPRPAPVWPPAASATGACWWPRRFRPSQRRPTRLLPLRFRFR